MFAGTIKLVGSVTDTTDKVDPVDTEADVDCETPPTVIADVDVGSRPELETSLKVIVVGLLLPLTHKLMEVILKSVLTFPLIVTAYALVLVSGKICVLDGAPVHVPIELSKVCCPYTTFKFNK